jgi:hypothetical protein
MSRLSDEEAVNIAELVQDNLNEKEGLDERTVSNQNNSNRGAKLY